MVLLYHDKSRIVDDDGSILTKLCNKEKYNTWSQRVQYSGPRFRAKYLAKEIGAGVSRVTDGCT